MSLNNEEALLLLAIARENIIHWLKKRRFADLPSSLPKALCVEDGSGAFVTLNRNQRLRGCIGLMESNLSLAATVQRMAVSAAFEDPRFPQLEQKELDGLVIEISVLSPKRLVDSVDEIQLGQDGVLVESQGRSGVFLPQVAVETGWDKERFLNELCEHKAGLEPDAWKNPDTHLYAFRAQILHEIE